MTSEKIAALKERIKKLIAKGEGTNNEHEAAVFLQKAHELMLTHNLTEADIHVPEFDSTVGEVFQQNSPASKKHELHNSVAKYFGCQTVLRVHRHANGGKTGRVHFDIHGTEAALATVELMFPYVWEDVLRRAEEQAKDELGPLAGPFPNELRKRKRKWTGLITDALRLRINELIAQRQAQAEMKPDADTSRALVLVSNALSEYVRDHYGGSDLPRIARKIRSAKKAGEIAEKISLDRQVDGTSPAALPGVGN